MSDLISRTEAIEMIRSMTISLGGNEIFHPEAKKSVLGVLGDLAAVDAMPKWISVDKRFPKDGDMVLTYIEYFYEVLQWDAMNELWVGSHGFHNKHYVTHWMPLPEPPKEDT